MQVTRFWLLAWLINRVELNLSTRKIQQNSEPFIETQSIISPITPLLSNFLPHFLTQASEVENMSKQRRHKCRYKVGNGSNMTSDGWSIRRYLRWRNLFLVVVAPHGRETFNGPVGGTVAVAAFYCRPSSPAVAKFVEEATASSGSLGAIASNYADAVTVVVLVVVAASIAWCIGFDDGVPTTTIIVVSDFDGGCHCGDSRKDRESCSEMHLNDSKVKRIEYLEIRLLWSRCYSDFVLKQRRLSYIVCHHSLLCCCLIATVVRCSAAFVATITDLVVPNRVVPNKHIPIERCTYCC